MTSKRFLCEILKDLSSEELEDFNLKVGLEKGAPLLSKHHPKGVNIEEVVELMVEKYSEESVDLTKNILMKMNRTDLVQRLSYGGAGTGEKHSVQTEAKQRSSLIQRVEMIMSDMEMLMDTLADLNEEEIEVFRDILIHTPSKINKSWTDINRIFGGDHQEIVFSMIMTCSQDSVEKTREILKKMGRTDLLQRLSDTSSRLKKKNSDEQHSALIQKVATMSAVQQLLFETLRCLSERELQRFMALLEQLVFRKGLRTIPSVERDRRGRGEIVDMMMETYGQQSVELTREVLEEMNRTDLTQMLLESSSTLKEKQPVDKHQPTSSAKAVKEDVQRLLFQTLWGLSFKELGKFKFLLQFTYFQRNLPQIYRIKPGPERQLEILVDLMVRNQQPVEVSKEVLMDMNRSDLVERLTGISSGLKERSRLDWQQRAETATSVTELLMETLDDLSEEELQSFKTHLKHICGVGYSDDNPWLELEERDHQETVLSIIMTCSRHSVEISREILKKMKRTDLVQRLSDTSSTLKKKNSDEQHSALIQKVATMAAVQQLLLEIMHGLCERELYEFMELLDQDAQKKGLRTIRSVWKYKRGRAPLLDLIMETYGQQSVELSKEVLEKMNRTDLTLMLLESSSTLKEKQSVDKHQPTSLAEAVQEDVQPFLFQTLWGLSFKELEKFKFFLQFTYFQRNLPKISWFKISPERQLKVLVYLMLKNQQPVEVTKEVLMDMNRSDLVERLTEISSGLKERTWLDWQQRVETATSVTELLMETLDDLSEKELQSFKTLMIDTYDMEYNYGNPWYKLGERDHQETVFSIIMTCSRHSVEISREILKKMKRTDLVQRLSDTSSTLKKKNSDEHHSALIQKVATMSAVQQLLLETLRCLSERELCEFLVLLEEVVSKKGLRTVSPVWRGREEIVNQMMGTYGQQSVELTREVLEKMNRTDLTQMLLESSSTFKEKHSVDKHQPTLLEKAVKEDVKRFLFQTLCGLSFKELKRFKFLLQFIYFQRSLPQISWVKTDPLHQLEELVDLMMENQQPVEVTKEVLMDMNRSDLVERLTEISSGLKEEPQPKRLEKPGSSLWTKLKPGVNSSSGDESPTYSLQCETGKFECSVSGLRWVCKEEVSFQYHFCSWGGHMERMERMKYMPAGPLMDIKVMTGRLNEVYLPHWICTEDDSKISDNFAALHIDDCGDVVENVSEVTPTHVKLSEPVFSPRGVLMKVGFPVKIGCCVLIYYKPNTPFLKLHVYLIPCDPALQQTVDKKERTKGFQTIEKPRPDKYLQMQKGFSLTADVETAKINPQKITLRYDNQDPNFYEVFIEKPETNLLLSLSYTSKREVQSAPVWTCEIRKDDYQNPASEDKPSVDDQLSAQMQKGLTISTTDRERLLKTLENLNQEEFKKFKWYLQDSGVLNDLQIISKSELENKDMLELVDLMLSTYKTECMELTRRVLRAMNKNDLAEKLSGIS